MEEKFAENKRCWLVWGGLNGGEGQLQLQGLWNELLLEASQPDL